AKLRGVVEKLHVYPDRMAENLALTKGLYFSQSILLALTRAGAERKVAYEAVQRAAMKTWKGEGTFAENAKREPEIAAKLSAVEIDRLCSLDIHFKHVDATFKALGLEYELFGLVLLFSIVSGRPDSQSIGWPNLVSSIAITSKSKNAHSYRSASI